MFLRQNHRHTGMDLRDEFIGLACDNRASAQPLPGFGIFPVFSRAGAKVNGRPSFNTRVGSLVLFTTISGLRYYRGRRSADPVAAVTQTQDAAYFMKTRTKVLNRIVNWKTAALAALAVASLASTPAV